MALLFCVDFILETHIKASYLPAWPTHSQAGVPQKKKRELLFPSAGSQYPGLVLIDLAQNQSLKTGDLVL